MSWSMLWLVVLVASFVSFTAISLGVAVKGVAEVRELFALLEHTARDRAPRDQA
jgi:hypothetical protein